MFSFKVILVVLGFNLLLLVLKCVCRPGVAQLYMEQLRVITYYTQSMCNIIFKEYVSWVLCQLGITIYVFIYKIPQYTYPSPMVSKQRAEDGLPYNVISSCHVAIRGCCLLCANSELIMPQIRWYDESSFSSALSCAWYLSFVPLSSVSCRISEAHVLHILWLWGYG